MSAAPPADRARDLLRRVVPAVAAVAAAAMLLALVSTGQAAAWRLYLGEPAPWVGLLRASVVDWYCLAAFVPALYWLARRLPIGRSRLAVSAPVHLAASVVFALLKESLFVAVGEYFRPGMFTLREILAGDFVSEILAFWALTGAVHAYVYRHPVAVVGAAEAPRDIRFTVRDRAGYRIVAAADVDWIRAEGNYAMLRAGGRAHLLRETMAGLEARLGPGFARVHRSAIVNVARIARIEPLSHGEYRILLSCGDAVTSGRSYNARVRALIG
jgi:DNA-binding LytR/AlgR family response regulator